MRKLAGSDAVLRYVAFRVTKRAKGEVEVTERRESWYSQEHSCEF